MARLVAGFGGHGCIGDASDTPPSTSRSQQHPRYRPASIRLRQDKLVRGCLAFDVRFNRKKKRPGSATEWRLQARRSYAKRCAAIRTVEGFRRTCSTSYAAVFRQSHTVRIHTQFASAHKQPLPIRCAERARNGPWPQCKLWIPSWRTFSVTNRKRWPCGRVRDASSAQDPGKENDGRLPPSLPAKCLVCFRPCASRMNRRRLRRFHPAYDDRALADGSRVLAYDEN
jgi:hypothetical protein